MEIIDSAAWTGRPHGLKPLWMRLMQRLLPGVDFQFYWPSFAITYNTIPDYEEAWGHWSSHFLCIGPWQFHWYSTP